ncbi:hypothetical protein HZC07_04050, partial [Candidatus Micrarchaeota archaeon]|nr:hypothetical protein [Candidatus Micrarchaeota archaeon]
KFSERVVELTNILERIAFGPDDCFREALRAYSEATVSPLVRFEFLLQQLALGIENHSIKSWRVAQIAREISIFFAESGNASDYVRSADSENYGLVNLLSVLKRSEVYPSLKTELDVTIAIVTAESRIHELEKDLISIELSRYRFAVRFVEVVCGSLAFAAFIASSLLKSTGFGILCVSELAGVLSSGFLLRVFKVGKLLSFNHREQVANIIADIRADTALLIAQARASLPELLE